MVKSPLWKQRRQQKRKEGTWTQRLKSELLREPRGWGCSHLGRHPPVQLLGAATACSGVAMNETIPGVSIMSTSWGDSHWTYSVTDRDAPILIPLATSASWTRALARPARRPRSRTVSWRSTVWCCWSLPSTGVSAPLLACLCYLEK